MKKLIFMVTRAIFENRGLGLDIKSSEDILFSSTSLEECQKEFEFRKSQLNEHLSYSDANDIYHQDITGIELYSMMFDVFNGDYEFIETIDSVYSRD